MRLLSVEIRTSLAFGHEAFMSDFDNNQIRQHHYVNVRKFTEDDLERRSRSKLARQLVSITVLRIDKDILN